MEQMIFSDSQTSVTKLDWRVSGIPISDTRTGHALFSLNMTRPIREQRICYEALENRLSEKNQCDHCV